LIAVIFLVFDLYAASTWRRSVDPQLAATLAASFGQLDSTGQRTIVALEDRSPLAAVGAHPGDSVAFDHVTDAFRRLAANDVIGITLQTGQGTRRVTLRPVPDLEVARDPAMAAFAFFAQFMAALMALALALAIGMRRPESLAMRAFAFGLLVDSPDFFCGFLPAGELQNGLALFLRPTIIVFYYPVFLYFALAFPEDRPWMQRRSIRNAFWVFSTLYIAVSLVVILSAAHAMPGTVQATVNTVQVRAVMAMVSVTISLIALFSSWRRSHGTLRQRLAWIGVCMGAITMTYFMSNLNLAMYFASDTEFDAAAFLVSFIAYAGLGYALLRHRLFDFGFAVNRALVFTIISTFLLLAFGVTEWGVDKLLHFKGREKNIIFDAAVALGIILSFHRIQHWVSHKVDHTFFHRWHEAAEKLRHFMEKAAHISDAEILREKYAHAIQAFSGAEGAAIYAHDQAADFLLRFSTLAGMPARLEQNHDVVVDLKHTQQAVELAGPIPGLPVEFAFPMMVRGRVHGVLLLGAKTGGHRYRPDEITLLMKSVQRLGLALESLRVEELELRTRDLSRRVELFEQKCTSLEQLATAQEREVAGLRLQLMTA
jgi:hypothetical protein